MWNAKTVEHLYALLVSVRKANRFWFQHVWCDWVTKKQKKPNMPNWFDSDNFYSCRLSTAIDSNGSCLHEEKKTRFLHLFNGNAFWVAANLTFFLIRLCCDFFFFQNQICFGFNHLNVTLCKGNNDYYISLTDDKSMITHKDKAKCWRTFWLVCVCVF